MYAIEVHFLDENDKVRAGELVNPNWVVDRRGALDVEFVGDNEVDVYCFRSNGEEHIFRTHISRVASMFPVVMA